MSGLSTRTINQALADACSIAFLNEAGQGTYTNALLLPLAAFVTGEIEDEFAKYGLQVKEKIDATNFSYTANASSITIAGAVTDFRHPIEIWEKPTGGEWIPMERVNSLPAPPLTAPAILGQWEYSEQTIKVNPCSVARSILIRYRRQYAYPADGTGTPGGEDYYWALVAGVAYYAAQGTNRFVEADRFNAIYRKRMMDAILVAGRDLQAVDVRQQSAAGGGYPNLRVVNN